MWAGETIMLAAIKTVAKSFNAGLMADRRRDNLTFHIPEGDASNPLDDILKPFADAVFAGQFTEAVRIIRALEASGQRGPRGRAACTVAAERLASPIVAENGHAERNETRLAFYADWARTSPHCPFATSAYATALAHTGYSYRGTGWARDVSEEAWEKLRSYSQRAESVMNASQPRFHTHYAWTLAYLRLALVANKPTPDHLSRFQMAVNANSHEREVYSAMAHAMMPRWFGSFDLIEHLARQCADATRPVMGETVYAFVYDYLLTYHPPAEMGFDWTRLKRGYADWLERFPDDTTRVRLAQFAFAVGDHDHCLDALEALCTLDVDAWEIEHDVIAVNSLCREFTGR